MKQKDDATLSLFGDELSASDLQDADASRKKIPDIQTVASIPHREMVIQSLGIGDLMGVG